MSATSNSPEMAFSLLHRASESASGWINESISNMPDTAYNAALVFLATFLVVFSSYATVSQPQSAKDPALGKDDPLFDQSDKDGSSFIISPAGSNAINAKLMDHTLAASVPFIVAAGLVGFSVLMKKFELSMPSISTLFIYSIAIPASTSAFMYSINSAARLVGYYLGLEGNSAYFFNRYRVTFSRDDKLPLGFYGREDRKALGMSKSEFKRYTNFMSRSNNVKFTRTTKVSTKKQIFSLIVDSKLLLAVPTTALFGYMCYAYNPVLNSNYQELRTSWIVNNLAGIFIIMESVKSLKLSSFKAGVVLLLGLCCYDAYFVFASTRMVDVVTGLDLPLKLTFPKESTPFISMTDGGQINIHSPKHYAMLGLGDIAMPAAFASLCLRFDYFSYYKAHPLPFHRLRGIGIPRYFTVAIAAYIVGLWTAIYVNEYSGRGQPALLYINPSLIAAELGFAWYCGELEDLKRYSEKVILYTDNEDGEEDSEIVREKGVEFSYVPKENSQYEEDGGSVREKGVEFSFVPKEDSEYEESEDETDYSYFIAGSDESDYSDTEIILDDDFIDELEFLRNDGFEPESS